MPRSSASPYFNPRSPHGERPTWSASMMPSRNFNPRSPHGERQSSTFASTVVMSDFNPRSPHGERPINSLKRLFNDIISIHAPRTGSDAIDAVYCHVGNISIHAPRTGSDNIYTAQGDLDKISIHAPRTGSDSRDGRGAQRLAHFNPRSPHGERPGGVYRASGRAGFQSTLPARGATCTRADVITASADFNPRSPHGERPSITIMQ